MNNLVRVNTIRGPWLSLGIHLDFQRWYIELHVAWSVITIGRDYCVSPAEVEGVGRRWEVEQLAALFHRFYEELAPDFGYQTRPESAGPWDEVPENNRYLMVAVASRVLAHIGRGRDLTCYGCGKPYIEFPLDVVLPNEQWQQISPTGDEGGILCAACIVARGAELPGVTVAKLTFQ